eukprot:7747383-Pyramimonas_sp.AAC.1
MSLPTLGPDDGAREEYLDRAIFLLDSRQRDDEHNGRRPTHIPDDRSSISGDQAQSVAHGMLIEENPGRELGNLISRASWLCQAPHFAPSLRPVLQVRGLGPRPREVIARWLPLTGVHAPADIVLRSGWAPKSQTSLPAQPWATSTS